MRIYPILLSSLLLSKLLPAQSIAETPAQTIANEFASLSSVSVSEKVAIKKAVNSLEQSGIYNKLFSLNIGKFFNDGKCYNVIVPLDYDGAFTLTVKNGAPVKTPAGIEMNDRDSLSTHFMSHLPSDAPAIGMFWYTDVPVHKPLIASLSPFNIEPWADGKAYVNIWNSAAGMVVPAPPAGFCLAQRVDESTIEFYQGTTKYSEEVPINSPNPTGYETLIIGNNEGSFTLKIFGITQALTENEVIAFKQIIDQLVIDLSL